MLTHLFVFTKTDVVIVVQDNNLLSLHIEGVSKEYYLPEYGFNNQQAVGRGKECNHIFGKNNLIKETKTFIRKSIPLIFYAFEHYRLSLILPSKPEQDLATKMWIDFATLIHCKAKVYHLPYQHSSVNEVVNSFLDNTSEAIHLKRKDLINAISPSN